MPFVLVLLAAAAPTAPALRTTIAVTNCATGECGAQRRSRYRLDPQMTDETDMKARALAENGRSCATSARRCTKRPRTIFSTSID